MRLISMTDFILSMVDKKTALEIANKSVLYARFLKQPLKLERFIPCDEEGDILEEPTNYEKRLLNMMTEYNDEVYTYYQAKGKVLFEGIDLERANYYCSLKNRTIENFVTFNLELSESAIKQIVL